MSRKKTSTERMKTPDTKFHCLGRNGRVVSLAFSTLAFLSPSLMEARDGDYFLRRDLQENNALIVSAQKVLRQASGIGDSDMARDAAAHEEKRQQEEGRGREESSPTRLRQLMSRQRTRHHRPTPVAGTTPMLEVEPISIAAPTTTGSSRAEEADGDGSVGSDRNAPIPNQWRNAHNRRRRSIHPEFGKTFVRINWDDSLAQTAQSVAQELVDAYGSDCGEGNQAFSVPYGYNAYAVKEDKTPEEVLVHWVDRQQLRQGEKWTLNKNGSFTMAVWRPSTRLGCHTVEGQTDTSETCYIHVCSYFLPGNCDITDESTNWDEMAFGDTSLCQVQAAGAQSL